MKIINIHDINLISTVIETLKKGGLVVYPTETCYGIGADATNTEAVTKILEYKRRPEGKSISVAVYNKQMASEYVEINESAENLFQNFLPGPVTIISKSKKNLDKRLESENGNLGIRIPNFRILLDIIKEFGKPITSTSANPIGKKTPYSIDDVLKNTSEKQKRLIDLVIDAGELPHNPPSTVIDTTTESLTIYRSGQIDPRKLILIKDITTNSAQETINFAEELIKEFSDAAIILLNGELGAGKTHFVKGIAKGLGINQVVKSPTYNYINEYRIINEKREDGSDINITGHSSLDALKLIHFDSWRIQSRDDLEALGFYKWFNKNNVVVIEWPTVISNLDPEIFDNLRSYFYIDLLKLNEEQREIRVYRKN